MFYMFESVLTVILKVGILLKIKTAITGWIDKKIMCEKTNEILFRFKEQKFLEMSTTS